MKQVVSKAPGKMFLTGEYAVLYGYPAIILAVNKYVTTKIEEANRFSFKAYNKKIEDLENVRRVSPHSYAVIKYYIENFDIDIKSVSVEIESDIPFKGLGSSSATMVSLSTALNRFFLLNIDSREVIQHLYKIKDRLEGGSIADIATSFLGGVVLIQQYKNDVKVEKLSPELLTKVFNIYAIYSGERQDTFEAIRNIRDKVRKKEYYKKLIDLMGETSKETINNWRNMDNLIKLIRLYHYLLASLGTSTRNIDEIVDYFENIGGAAKISGAGYGDSVLALTFKEQDQLALKYKWIKIDIDKNGVVVKYK